MGITGLLPFLEKATKPCHISEFRGATVVIDTYCWLHRGATTCAIQLVQGEETNMYVTYCMKYIKMLQSYDIKPILVFDGKNLPAKAGTEAKRRESRKKAKQRAAELLSLGKTEEARSHLKASLNITPEMASALIKECHKVYVDCIVAPYESDAQLAFFNLKGIAELVITEDSDLVLFGCSKIFYKLDLRGCGYLVDAEKICTAMSIRPDKYTFDKFRHMCILSGCDYVDSLQGIGLKKAQKFITLTDETDPEKFLDKIPRYLRMHSLEITEEYKKNFMIADATFRHQIVFDPFKRKLIPLFDPQVIGTNPKYCQNAGEIYDQSKAYQVALGNFHPSSFTKLNDWDPKRAGVTNKSIWYNGSYEISVSRKEQKQKAAFKNFFNQSNNKMISVMDDSQLKLEEDQVNKELEFYTKPVPVKEGVEIEENDAEKEQKISPVLKKNPFIKKFSKFQRTQLNSSVIIKSRYFSSEQMEVQETQSSDNTIKDLTEVESNDCNVTNENNTHEPDEEISAPAKEFSDLELVENKTDVKVETESKYFTSQKKDLVTNTFSAKRKLIGPCRSLGLKKSKAQGQQSISNFFTKLGKPS